MPRRCWPNGPHPGAAGLGPIATEQAAMARGDARPPRSQHAAVREGTGTGESLTLRKRGGADQFWWAWRDQREMFLGHVYPSHCTVVEIGCVSSASCAPCRGVSPSINVLVWGLLSWTEIQQNAPCVLLLSVLASVRSAGLITAFVPGSKDDSGQCC